MSTENANVEPAWQPPVDRRWDLADGRAMCDALSRSGLSKRRFAKTFGVSIQRVHYWTQKLWPAKPEQSADQAEQTFVSARFSPDPLGSSTTSLTMVAPDGWRVEFGDAISPTQVAELLSALRTKGS